MISATHDANGTLVHDFIGSMGDGSNDLFYIPKSERSKLKYHKNTNAFECLDGIKTIHLGDVCDMLDAERNLENMNAIAYALDDREDLQ